jgi:hypothetical protein
MPQKDQRSVTIPKRIYDLAEKYFNEHEEELLLEDITTVTAMIRRWIVQSVAEKQKPHAG